jgi:phage terminase small subunit
VKNVRKAKFTQALFAGLSQKEAALRAGYKDGPGIEATASKLAKDKEVRAELARLQGVGTVAAIAEREEALRLLTEQMRGDLSEFIGFHDAVIRDAQGEIMKGIDGQPLMERVPRIDIEKAMKAGKIHLISAFEITDKGNIKVKLPDVQGAIDRLAKLLGWNLPDKVDIKHSGAPASLADAELLAEAKKYGINP